MLSLSKDFQTKFSKAVCLATRAAIEFGSTRIIGIGVDDSPEDGAKGGRGSPTSLLAGSNKGALLCSTVTEELIGVPVGVSVGVC